MEVIDIRAREQRGPARQVVQSVHKDGKLAGPIGQAKPARSIGETVLTGTQALAHGISALLATATSYLFVRFQSTETISSTVNCPRLIVRVLRCNFHGPNQAVKLLC